MSRILYFGNHFPGTVMYDLVPKLADIWPIVPAAQHRNQWKRALAMLWVFFRYCRSSQCVIIDTYSTRNFYFAWGLALLCRLFNLPYFPFLHGGNLPARLVRSPNLCRQFFGHAAVNIAPSAYLKQAFEQASFRTLLIPNFINIKDYSYQKRAKIQPKLLWVRAFEQTYHPEMALHVLAKLLKKYPDAQLCMVGADKDGSMAKCIELAQALNLQERVQFTGRLSKIEWWALSREYDIFVNTTRFDNTPISVMEAMALGLPLVSTDVGGMPYLIESGETGLLCPNEDVQAMSDHIENLLTNPGLVEKISQKARKKAESFDWQVVGLAWQHLLANPIAQI